MDKIIITVVSEIAEHTIIPLLSPLARPFKPFWAYKKNFEKLDNQDEKLQRKKEELQGSIDDDVQPPEDVRNWQREVNNICHDIPRLRDERETLSGCSAYLNVKKSYTHRRTVAKKLKAVDGLERRLKNSESPWKYRIEVQNLKKKVDDLMDEERRVVAEIKDGERPLPSVWNWLEKVVTIDTGLINLQPPQQPQEQQPIPDYSLLRDNVIRKLSEVERLLQEGKGFEVFAEETEQTKYEKCLSRLKEQMDVLTGEEGRVKSQIKEGERAVSNVGIWMARVSSIKTELQPPQEQSPDYSLLGVNVALKLSEVERLLQEGRGFEVFSEETEETKYREDHLRLKEQVEMLELKEKDVQRRIEPGEEPLLMVEKWLADVRNVLDQVSLLAGEYSLEEHTKITNLLEKAGHFLEQQMHFTVVSRQIPPGSINYLFTVQETFQARMSILESIVKHLKEDNIYMVGIHGMGGVGKTTLAKHIGVKLIGDKIFGKVIFAEVSQTPNIKSIQATIAEALGPSLEGESESGRATKLHERLKKVSGDGIQTLIILDNLWEEIKLDDIGIPSNSKGVKLLLTARSRHLLSNKMESQHEFNVEALGEDDAWTLFKSMAGKCVDHPSLESISKEVAKNCGGMPVAIVPVAKALKHKMSVAEWEDALQKLKTPSLDHFEDDITKELYNSVKLSYRCLSGNLRDIFLLCGRLQNTHDVSIEDLLTYGFGFGSDSMKNALNRAQSSINHLKDVSLLLDAPTPGDDRFALHDTVCTIARSIASCYVFYGDHLPGVVSFKNSLREYASITLSNIEEIPDFFAELKFPNLKFLYMRSQCFRLKVPDNFFQGMPSLQVLHFIRMDLSPPPKTFNLLKDLQTLCLEECLIKDVALEHMKNLEILSFRCSTLKELPREICHLSLRILDLKGCYNCTHIPLEISSNLTSIEAFYANHTISIDNMKNWSNLVILEIMVRDAEACRDLRLCNLRRYEITIGTSDWCLYRNPRS